jgi:cellulose synthase/poly-beta-1,6-N-acetylglucosamine synthase-like glycosyltransferase
MGSQRKGTALNRSLTLLLPVRDAQSTLAATVTQALEMASDLSEIFELLIIDDGSTDATIEVARELSRHYPQIRTIRHSQPLGEEAALQSAFAQSPGDVVLVRGQRRLTFERLSWASQPVRPNYLGRARTFASEGL